MTCERHEPDRCVNANLNVGHLRSNSAVFFTAEVNVATLVQKIQGQACKHQESKNNFPHTKFLSKKKTPGF